MMRRVGSFPDAKRKLGRQDQLMAPRLHLELDLKISEPIAGTMAASDGRRHTFTGWLQLLAALESLCAAARIDQESGDGGKPPSSEPRSCDDLQRPRRHSW
ncbi:MAG: hypothetical protein M3285_05415 [Actinomycetota bacterium]|nr:hypothetical protein [Actinomycetota bacterium]